MYGFITEIDQGEKRMRGKATLGLLLLLASVMSSAAQVKRVQMHIAGYLCGN